MATSLKVFAGELAEYRSDDGRLLGVMTGVEHSGGMLLQHLMVWPGAPAGTLLRMIRAVERTMWDRGYPFLILDLEHTHPDSERLTRLASRYGFNVLQQDTSTTWFIKHRENDR